MDSATWGQWEQVLQAAVAAVNDRLDAQLIHTCQAVGHPSSLPRQVLAVRESSRVAGS